MIGTMKNILNNKKAYNVITVLDTVIFIILLVFSSCSNNTQQDITPSEIPDVITQEPEQNQEQGIAIVKMFVPDYYALAEQNGARTIAPQTKTARLSYQLNGSWVGITSIDLSTATKTPVENAPDGFTGSVYTCTFNGVPVGTYNIDNLKIELMDISGNTITSGTNTTSVTITRGGSASTTFYTVPTTTGANTGNLSAGEMKFGRAALIKGVEYPVKITSNGDYPDLVLFKSNGQFYKYYAIDTQEQASVTLTVEETDVYFLGLWADDGKAIARYTFAFDFGNGTELKGVLTGNNLNWTKANSPYFVNGNLLVEAGSELSIEPGVIVQFTGNYYIRINGGINAIGSNEEPIVFTQSGDNLNSWAGITINGGSNLLINDYEYVSGNIMKNCMIIGASNPLILNSSVYVDFCSFVGNGGDIPVTGSSILKNCKIESGISCADGVTIINNDIQGNINCGGNFYGKILKNEIYGEITYGKPFSGSIINNVIHRGINYSGCVYEEYSVDNGLIINNDIYGSVSISGELSIKNNTFSSGDISIYDYSGNFTSNIINTCPINISSFWGTIVGNNFVGYKDTIVDVSSSSSAIYDFTGNYWGESQTSELNELGSKANISFFNDYYDNFEWTKINYSNWATEPIEGVGYIGDSLIIFDYTINGYDFSRDEGWVGPYQESSSTELAIVIKPQYHANEIVSIRLAQSLAELNTTEWISYNSNQLFTVDKNKLLDGVATIYVQLKDSEGNLTNPVMHEVPFDNPVVTLSVTDGSTYSVANSPLVLNYGASDKGSLISYELYLDGQIIASDSEYDEEGWSYGWGRSYSSSYTLDLTNISVGEHVIKATFRDKAGNSTTKTASFTITNGE